MWSSSWYEWLEISWEWEDIPYIIESHTIRKLFSSFSGREEMRQKHRPFKDQRTEFLGLKSIKTRNHCVHLLNFHLQKCNRTLTEQVIANTSKYTHRIKLFPIINTIEKLSSYRIQGEIKHTIFFIINPTIRRHDHTKASRSRWVWVIKTSNVSSKLVLHLQQA